MKALLFIVDGMRPDGLRQADTPIMDSLIASGAHSFEARTVMPSITLPCITSLFLGVKPERHGVTTNTWEPQAWPVPSLFEVIHEAGLQTAFFYNWEQLRDVSRPGALNASFFLRNCDDPTGAGDRELAALAADWLRGKEIDFAAVYLGATDVAGHDTGWMTAQYLKCVASADHCIGTVSEVFSKDVGIIVTADHGGHERAHGTECEEDMTIPFIVAGPGVPKNYTIQRQVAITDIAPTVTALLGLKTPSEWIGQAIEFG